MPGVKFGKRRQPQVQRQASQDLLPLSAPREEGLLPPDASWRELWTAMPAFEMGDKEAVQKIIVHFRSREDVERFSALIGDAAWTNGRGSNITERTDSMWFGREEDYIAPKELLWVNDNAVPLRYPLYIISKGRWEDPRTANALAAIDVPYRIVVEPAERDAYARTLGEERLLVAPENFSERGQGSIPVRNFVWEHAVASGASRHWIFDDNIRRFLRMHRNRRIPVAGNGIFLAVEDFVNRYENIALAGFTYMYLIKDRGDYWPPYYLNTRIYSMILVNHAWRPEERWRGRYNEDTDLSLRALKDGWCTVLFNAFLGDKAPTLTMKGGNADIYAESDKRREFAESLANQHPDVASVVWRYDRWHHEVNYAPFAGNRLIERTNWIPPSDPEYGMRIERTGPRYPTAPVALTPITFAPKSNKIDPSPISFAVPVPLVPETIGFGEVAKESVACQPPSKPSAQAAVVFAPRTSHLAPIMPVSLAAGRPRTAVENPFLAHHRATLDAAGDDPLQLDAATWDRAARSAVGLDVECFANFFCVVAKRFEDGRSIAFERSDRTNLDAAALESLLTGNLTFGFNSHTYDLPMVYLALSGATNAQLKLASDRIVRGNLRPWDAGRELGVRVPRNLNHVDLMEPNPSVRQSLKMLAGRLHQRFLVDLPFDPEAILSPRDMNLATLYCLNDVEALGLLREAMLPALELRTALGRAHGADFRSRSDAQIGEAIVLRRIERKTGQRVIKPDVRPRTFRYSPPPWAQFNNERIRWILDEINNAEFRADEGGKITVPKVLENLVVEIGEGRYAMGIGGLHSQEEHRAILSDSEYQLVDVDVSSHYPSIISKLGLYPEALGPSFVEVYRSIYNERLAGKKRLTAIDDEIASLKRRLLEIEGG